MREPNPAGSERRHGVATALSSLAVMVLVFLAGPAAAAESLDALGAVVAKMRPGVWYEIPDSSIESVLIKENEAPEGTWAKGSRHVIFAWNGAAFDGRRMYFHGGGHAGYGGNEVYAFDLATLRWERLSEPSPLIPPSANWRDDGQRCLGVADDAPIASHTYDGFIYSPRTHSLFLWGAAPFCANGWGGPGRSPEPKGWEFDLTTRKWHHHGLPPSPHGIMRTALDPASGKIFLIAGKTAWEFDPTTRTYDRRSPSYGQSGEGVAAFDPKRRRLLLLDFQGARTMTVDGGSLGSADTLALSGDVPASDRPRRPPYREWGVEFSSRRDLFVLWTGARDTYSLDPATGRMERYANPDGPAPALVRAGHSRVYSKWAYVPEYDVFVGYNNAEQGVWLYRLPDRPQPGSALASTEREGGNGSAAERRQRPRDAERGQRGQQRSRPQREEREERAERRRPDREERMAGRQRDGGGGGRRQGAKGEPALGADGQGKIRLCRDGEAEGTCARYGLLNDAVKEAKPGDQIVLPAGEYVQCAVIKTNGLHIRGEAGAHLTRLACEGKAALVVRASNVVIEGIECSNIAVSDRNGACIRIEGGKITVRNVYFHDNDEGILGGGSDGVVTIEGSRFERNGRDGRAHGVYISKGVDALIFRDNVVLTTQGEGHGVKSRARRTVIENCVIAGLDGKDSRAIDVPIGGEVVVRGNVLEKGPNSENIDMIGIAREISRRGGHEDNSTLIEDNIIIFDSPQGRVMSSESPGPVTLRNNRIIGTSQLGTNFVDEGGNTVFESREKAGLPPYPALPERP